MIQFGKKEAGLTAALLLGGVGAEALAQPPAAVVEREDEEKSEKKESTIKYRGFKLSQTADGILQIEDNTGSSVKCRVGGLDLEGPLVHVLSGGSKKSEEVLKSGMALGDMVSTETNPLSPIGRASRTSTMNIALEKLSIMYDMLAALDRYDDENSNSNPYTTLEDALRKALKKEITYVAGKAGKEPADFLKQEVLDQAGL